MARITRQLELPYTPNQMMALVGDVEKYPDFINLIKALRITKTAIDTATEDKRLAEARIAYKNISAGFSTWVTRQTDTKTISVDLEKGPFKHLSNKWQFTPSENNGDTKIDFSIDYEFSNPVFRMLLERRFDRLTEQIMQAFINEAKRRYG